MRDSGSTRLYKLRNSMLPHTYDCNISYKAGLWGDTIAAVSTV